LQDFQDDRSCEGLRMPTPCLKDAIPGSRDSRRLIGFPPYAEMIHAYFVDCITFQNEVCSCATVKFGALVSSGSK
jgi:hypothetical protein